MNDKQPELLPGLDRSDDPDFIRMQKLIEKRGLVRTIDLAAQYCERHIAIALQTKNLARRTAWLKRRDALLYCASTIDKT